MIARKHQGRQQKTYAGCPEPCMSPSSSSSGKRNLRRGGAAVCVKWRRSAGAVSASRRSRFALRWRWSKKGLHCSSHPKPPRSAVRLSPLRPPLRPVCVQGVRHSSARTSLAHLAERLRVGSLLLANTHDHVHEPTVVLQPLLGAASLLLLLLTLRDLRCLTTHLARTSERTVDLALRCGESHSRPTRQRRGGRRLMWRARHRRRTKPRRRVPWL